MADLKELYQSADWKKEKHAPVIDISGKPGKDQVVSITVSVGKEIPHPNTTAHHISWIEVYFLPKGEKFPCEIGRFEFASHGASAQGADTSAVYTHPEISLKLKTEKSGTVMASSYCNIHGLWQGSKELA
ncbi:MAG: class II SORL domain-containing protein [Candidatus Omnitrophica bacterium]|nr:class II SORL domain-containing protein [Candidatus Omnitrophota bacterium]MBU4589423.1 class II SORL domain-containing protein [Candidatus Omnitrophota bacterium]